LTISGGIPADADDPVAVDRMADVEELITYTRMWEEKPVGVDSATEGSYIPLRPTETSLPGKASEKTSFAN
jgi:hypothetical protein